jgi:hypothetical protein
MAQRVACPPAPGPLEAFAARFDELFGTLAQRRGFRAYLQGLLSPRERTKTLTALAADAPSAPADLAEVVHLYALRDWVEHGYKQAKHELGWADFQVRSDRAIRRHWAMVCCAFSFCWRAWIAKPPAPADAAGAPAPDPAPGSGRESRPATSSGRSRRTPGSWT